MENMINTKRPTILNYLLPLIMIAGGLLHYRKHGLDLLTIIYISSGVFPLYMALFNHLLLQRALGVLTRVWYPIGQYITIILLTITFFVLFAPVGLLLRLFRKDILNKNFKVGHLSYWIDRPKNEQNNYTKQF